MSALENRYRVLFASFGDTKSAARWRRKLSDSYEHIVDALILNFASDLALSPKDLDQDHIEILLKELFPGRLGDQPPHLEELPDLVCDFLMHTCLEEGVALEWEWRSAVDKSSSSFLQAMENQERPRFAGPKGVPDRRPGQKIGRNDPCPCGSGKKYKRCCAK